MVTVLDLYAVFIHIYNIIYYCVLRTGRYYYMYNTYRILHSYILPADGHAQFTWEHVIITIYFISSSLLAETNIILFGRRQGVRRRRRILHAVFMTCVCGASVGFGADGNLIALRTSAADQNQKCVAEFFSHRPH